MKRALIIGVVVIAVLVLAIGGWIAGTYNKLVVSNEGVDQRWAQVDNQLQRRNDLIGNLMETVKGTALQEQEVFGNIADARARLAGAGSRAEGIAAGRAMDSALARLLVVVENYPQLRSNEAFLNLMDNLSGTENRLSTERMRYNQQVQGHNVLVKRFPTRFFASAFNFGEAEYYEIDEAAREVPEIDFSGLRNEGGDSGE